MSAILYNYRQEHWDGLSQFLTIILSRIGFTPSAIMVDDNFDFQHNKFSALDSFISQIETTINQLTDEVTIDNSSFLLTGFQKKIWNGCMESKFIGISAPTSAGKSFVILLKSIDNILKSNHNIIYIVPTLSLITQIVNDYHTQLKRFGLENYEILTSYNGKDNSHKIYVLTPERAMAAYSESEKPFGEVDTFIVDEIQNIERIENEKDERAKILFDSLVELSFSYSPKLTIFSGPRVSGLRDMGIEIFRDKEAVEINTEASPVANFTYSISKTNKKYFFNQYSQLNTEPTRLQIRNTDIIKIGGKQYNEKYFEYLSAVVKLLGENVKNVIFAPSSGMARKIAINLSDRLNSNEADDSCLIESLIDYISRTIHPCYSLVTTLKKRVIYHHGKVPLHIRNVLEYAIKEKLINNIVCTTTLMQGVNLPAQNVIMRNAFLSTRSNKGVMPELTNYEISNLRGRAGRLLKDFIGRTFVLDENAFHKKDEQSELFQNESKTLTTGYGNLYTKYSKQINESLSQNIYTEELNNSGNDLNFLITYIRYIILKHNHNSYERLNSAGIYISKDNIEKFRKELTESLIIPIEICFKNRYVDPLVLNDIYKNKESFTLPLNVTDKDFSIKLFHAVEYIRKTYPVLYLKHFTHELDETFFYTVSDWIKEKSLSSILKHDYFDTPDKIDSCIDRIQKNICFNLTALLKPFYSIKDINSNILSCIEMGAFNPITMELIKLNIPREVALILKDTIFMEVPENINNQFIINTINSRISEIDFWNIKQLTHLLH